MIKLEVKPFSFTWKISFLCYTSSKLILLYHTKQLTGGGHEEICDMWGMILKCLETTALDKNTYNAPIKVPIY